MIVGEYCHRLSTFSQGHSMLLSKAILRLVRLDAQHTVDVYTVICGGVIYPSRPLRAVGPDARARRSRGPHNANVIFTGPSLRNAKRS